MASGYNAWGLPDDNGGYESWLGALGPKTPKINPYGTLNPEQIAVNRSVGPEIQSRATANPSQFLYNGQLTAPMTSGEGDVVANNARMNAVAGNTFSRIGNYDPEQVNRDFNQYVQKPTLDNWMQNEAPYLREQLSGFSSEQGNVLSKALTTQQNNLAQQRMGYLQQAQTNALSALSGANTYNQGSAAIQAIPREIQQAGLTAAYNNFIQANIQKSDSINQALAFLGLSTGTFYQPQSEGETLINAGKTGAQLAAMAGA